MAVATLLAGDLGGTKTLLLLAERGGEGVLFEQRYENDRFACLEEVLRDFLIRCREKGWAMPEVACLGVAGPVKNGMARITNLAWDVSECGIARDMGGATVRLINDFEAVGHGVNDLKEDEILVLQEGSARENGVRAVIGAGTGLGEAILAPLAGNWQVLPGEGAHVDFAPRDEFEAGLWRWLRQRHGHVSYERIVSGDGLVNVFTYLRDIVCLPVSAGLAEQMEKGDPAAAISEFGCNGGDVAAAKALEVFISVYGAEAGNLALKCLPFGGVYIAGGIAPKLADRILAGGFMAAFRDKGRFSPLMVEFPVRLVRNHRVGLLGAVRVARSIPV